MAIHLQLTWVNSGTCWSCIYSAPEDFKVNPGAIETVLQHPAAYDKVQLLPCLI